MPGSGRHLFAQRLVRLLLICLLAACGTLPDHDLAQPQRAGAELHEVTEELVDFALSALVDVGAGAASTGTTHGVAVLPFSTAGRTSALGDHLARQLETAMAELLWVRGIHDVVVVSRRHIADLLREQSLTMSDAFAQGPAEVLGRLRGADLLITGELSAAGDSSDLLLQILNVPDGRVLRGHNMLLPISLPGFEAAAASRGEQVNTPPTTASISTGPIPSPGLLGATTDRGLALLDSEGQPSSDVGVIVTVGRNLLDSSLKDTDSDQRGQGLETQLTSADRQPLDLCLLLDTSGSMEQQNRLAYARFAADQIVDALQPGDRFCLITFSDKASALMQMADASESSKINAHHLINSLRAGGKTDFESALREIHHMPMLQRAAAMTHYVVLISDGKPTAGMQDPEVLGSMARDIAARGASIHTLGVSQGIRFAVLNEIANQGAGRMHVLDDPRSLAAFLPHLVDSAANLQADQARLEFRPAPGMRVHVKSTNWRQDPDGVLRASLGLVRRNEKIVRLVHLTPDGSVAFLPGQSIPIGAARLTYTEPDGRQVTEEADVRIETTSDAELFRQSARLEILLASHLIGLRGELMSVHDLLLEEQSELAIEHLREALEHMELVLRDQDDPFDVLAPLRRLAERTREYETALELDPSDATIRGRLYRDASSQPEAYDTLDD